MGTLFPDSDEHPDHCALSVELQPAQLIVPLAITAVLYGSCPINEERHEHVPHQEAAHVILPTPIAISSSDSGAGINPLTWQNSSMFDAANEVIRRDQVLRQTAHASLSFTQGSTALLTLV
jgi:hypothetical protein